MSRSTISKLHDGWNTQTRVIYALMIRELNTRFGRENIGFLWIMAEPLLFAGLVGLVWRLTKGSDAHGMSIIAFVATGYIPLTLFRHCVGRSAAIFQANGSLLYHQQVKILDFVAARILIEFLGGTMAYLFMAVVLIYFGQFPVPADIGLLIAGWVMYALISLSISLVVAPLSEISDVMEKFIPVITYIMIPFSGVFAMASWLTPAAREYLLWSPFVNAMEMMRGGIWGDKIAVYYGWTTPMAFIVITSFIGLALCRRVRRTLSIE